MDIQPSLECQAVPPCDYQFQIKSFFINNIHVFHSGSLIAYISNKVNQLMTLRKKILFAALSLAVVSGIALTPQLRANLANVVASAVWGA